LSYFAKLNLAIKHYTTLAIKESNRKEKFLPAIKVVKTIPDFLDIQLQSIQRLFSSWIPLPKSDGADAYLKYSPKLPDQ